MFLSINKKNDVYPCIPQFYYIKKGFKGVKIIQACFRDELHHSDPEVVAQSIPFIYFILFYLFILFSEKKIKHDIAHKSSVRERVYRKLDYLVEFQNSVFSK